ncbi:MAG: hypothetical protein ACXV3V_01565 [Actinomycetes bacterium]
MDTFDWTTHPEAEALVASLVTDALAVSPAARAFADRVTRGTSTHLTDWLDHIGGPVAVADLAAAGFVDGWGTAPGVWRHPGAQVPAIVAGADRVLALRVDDAAAFGSAHGGSAGVTGSPGAGLRTAQVVDSPVRVLGVERRSWAAGVSPVEQGDAQQLSVVRARRLWTERPRTYDVAAGLADAHRRAEEMVGLVGADLAASYVMEEERAFWQRRNTAAAMQHARQDRFGLGWGNNDHHTFRSSREAFRGLIDVLRVLGFSLRERFYAGDEAGWGAQVLEQPGAGLVVFADVDLTPDEVSVDFASSDLPPSRQLGTVGLWCALHGESLLAAGMHHLEGQFDFDQLRDDLASRSIGQMRPFSDLPHLRQAFTEPERWPVEPGRLAGLVAAGTLTAEKAAEFAAAGAAGSHLENLARRGGFKGFNQANVSTTIAATDPRVLA